MVLRCFFNVASHPWHAIRQAQRIAARRLGQLTWQYDCGPRRLGGPGSATSSFDTYQLSPSNLSQLSAYPVVEDIKASSVTRRPRRCYFDSAEPYDGTSAS